MCVMCMYKYFQLHGVPVTHCMTLMCLSAQVCLERAMKRGQTSGRVDDNIESFRKR